MTTLRPMATGVKVRVMAINVSLGGCVCVSVFGRVITADVVLPATTELCVKTLGTFFVQNSRHSRLFSFIFVHSRSILGASPVLLVPFSACVRDAVGVRAGGGAAGGGREGPGRNPRSRIDPNAGGADLGAWEGPGWGRGEPWGRRARGWAGISWRASASACVNGRRA